MKAVIGFILALAMPVFAQQSDLKPKSSPAADALVELAKSQTSDQGLLNVKMQQARSTIDQNNKQLIADIQSAQKDLQDKLEQDKKYKPLIDHINDTQKKLNESGQKVAADYQRDNGVLAQRIQNETVQVQGLIPVVRKENGFPDNAAFDIETQKWTVPKQPDKK